MKIKLVALGLTVLLFAGCRGNGNQQTQNSVITQSQQPSEIEDSPGRQVYNTICIVCHMADGSGVPGLNPPITGTEFVNGDPEQLIKIVLEGKSGGVEINGKSYNGIMPPQPNLTNQQIADVLTYVRANFGNDSEAITPDEVQRIRN